MSDNLLVHRSDEENAKKLSEEIRRFNDLRDRLTLRNADVIRLEAEQAQAASEAEEKFGTSDVDLLRVALQQGQRENTLAVDNFSKHLDEIEADLAKISGAQTEIGVVSNSRLQKPLR